MKATTLPTLREYFKYLFSQYSKSEITGIVLAESFHKFEQFTAQKLALWMFVPCNSKGEPMEKPTGVIKDVDIYAKQYEKALDACIFEGWEIKDMTTGRHFKLVNGKNHIATFYTKNNRKAWGYKSIEELLTAGIPLTLKPNHAKELNL